MEEFWLGNFVKNENILCSYGETGRNEKKREIQLDREM